MRDIIELLVADYGFSSVWEMLRSAARIDSEMVELPRDRDGVPIRVGDTVYGEDGRAWHVEGISFGRWTKLVDGHVVHAMGDSGQWRDLMPEWLTHERPDSLERIRKMAAKKEDE